MALQQRSVSLFCQDLNPAPRTLVCCFLLQDLALRRSVRVTFLSGDVHVAAAGKLMTHPRGIDLRADHRYMLQVWQYMLSGMALHAAGMALPAAGIALHANIGAAQHSCFIAGTHFPHYFFTFSLFLNLRAPILLPAGHCSMQLAQSRGVACS